MRRVLKIVAYVAMTLSVLLIAAAGYLYVRISRGVVGQAPDRPSVLRYAEEPPAAVPQAGLPAEAFDFEPGAFREPDRRYGPFTRWWWPGNDVDQAELKREVEMLAAAGFAGVEIQPFVMGLDTEAPQAERARVLSWDDESYYHNLRAVMEAALEAGVVVDLNNGSGWPTGGPQIAIEDNFRTLLFRETATAGGRRVRLELEPPDAPLSAYLSLLLSSLMGGPEAGVHYPGLAKLEAVVAAKTIEDQRSSWVWSVSDQVRLDPTSAVDVTGHVEGDVLSWNAPEGQWRVIAFWSLPDGETPSLLARQDPGFVLDHFDAPRVRANYDYLLGSRTGLAPYYGRPLRAVFNDSYEFKADRHFTRDFFEVFERRRGYDVRPWLPANMKPGYNHIFAHLMLPQAKPEFVYSEEDWRLRHDYDLTLSELLLERFLDTSAEWLSRRGMQHRTQAYGMPMDVIGASGRAHIPEAEQLYWGGSEAFLKAVSSGAHLYGRPVTTAESVVYMNRAYMTTPQKIKISVDKALTSGINQIIYHGTAYRYGGAGVGEEGWFPWCSPHMPFMNFSFDLRETNPFWKHVGAINAYVTRAQYALRSGRPTADVLIYYPFLGFAMGGEVPNPEELLPRGYFAGVEPPLPPVSFGLEPGAPEDSVEALWFERVWDVINTLEEHGVTWEWVNDESLQKAALEDGRIAIRGHRFEALILPHLPFVSSPTASHLHELAARGARVVVVGEAPRRQPSFLDYEARDREVAELFAGILAAGGAARLADADGLAAWAASLERPLRYAEPYRHLRQIQRVMRDGSRVAFIRSKSDEWTEIRVELGSAFGHALWLNPVDGAVYGVEDATAAAYSLPPFGSILLYAATGRAAPRLELSRPPPRPGDGRLVTAIERWEVRSGATERSGVALFDWRDDDSLRGASEAVYRARFELPEAPPGSRFLLDLGRVHFTAEVAINGQPAGSAIHAPYTVDVTALAQPGENALAVTVTATQLNELIARGSAGDERYRQFEGREDLMPAGLMGPVQVWAIDAETRAP